MTDVREMKFDQNRQMTIDTYKNDWSIEKVERGILHDYCREMGGFRTILALDFDLDETFEYDCHLDGNYLCTISHDKGDRITKEPMPGFQAYRLVVRWPRDGRKEYWTLELMVWDSGEFREYPIGKKSVSSLLYDDKMVIHTPTVASVQQVDRQRQAQSEEEKLRVIGERLAHQINRLNQLRRDVSKLKGYIQQHRNVMPSSTDFETNLGAIYALFPVENTAFVVFDMENRLSKDIGVGLGKVQEFLTYFNVADYPELEYIEKKIEAIRDALRELLKDNKSTVTEYSEAQKKTSEESNGEDNPPVGDSAAPEEAKGDKEPGFWNRVKKWRPFGRGENIKSLLLELKALGDDSPF